MSPDVITHLATPISNARRVGLGGLTPTPVGERTRVVPCDPSSTARAVTTVMDVRPPLPRNFK